MKVRLDEVCNLYKGKTTITKAIQGKYPLVVTAENRASSNEYQFDCKAVCVPLVSATGHGHASIKRLHYQEGKFALGTILSAVIPKDENILDTKYLYIYLSYFKDSVLVPLMRGSANVSLTIKSLGSAEIELPSIEEQKNIVELVTRIENIKSKIDIKLEEQSKLVLLIRNEILNMAIKGKLIQPDKNAESASRLLKRIKDEIEELKLQGRYNKQRKVKDTVDAEINYGNLPSNWKWCLLDDVVPYITDYQSNGSFSSLKSNVKTYKEEEYAILVRLKDLRLNIENNDLVYTDKSGYDFLSKSHLHGGEILIANVGAGVGTSMIMPNINKKSTIAPNMFIIELSKYINKDYFMYFTKSNLYKNEILSKASATGQPKMNKNEFRSLTFPLPPLSEQIRIVEKVDKLIKVCDELELRIEKSKKYSEKLMESILKDSLKA
ncbi:restriction endonuclease subunit S [Terrisporobacter sp.]|uniref:restriction endonuclease subunit S n=1 Tax=Terrisporobacter sp. TaxID=1965305 RepID=UPI003992FCA6